MMKFRKWGKASHDATSVTGISRSAKAIEGVSMPEKSVASRKLLAVSVGLTVSST